MVFGAMAAGPMLIGHTGMNYALRHFRATTVNVAALGTGGSDAPRLDHPRDS